MKTKQLLTAMLCIFFTAAFGQKTFAVKVDNDKKKFSFPEDGEKKADFTETIILSFEGELPNNLKLKPDGAKLKDHEKASEFVFEVDKDRTDPVNIEITAKDFETKSISIINGKKNEGDDKDEKNPSYKTLYNSYCAQTDTYIREDDKAHYYFDEKGLLLSLAPVNVDADDYIVVHMIVPEDSDMTIEVIGNYDPSDLNGRPYEAINVTALAHSVKEGIKYKQIVRTFGPFTKTARIKFFKGSTEITNHLDVKINDLYHYAIGASFVSTELERPEFDVFQIPGTTDNTINTINTGKRTMATFNVIFYWKASIDYLRGKLVKKTHITQGRDILKEATLWERINPTFGVSINSEWRENLFFGGNFEFTRGGSISAGWHYGKIQKLADRNFKLGTDVYTGTKDEIKLTDTWETGFFIGITLDTRIFNKVLSRN